MMNPYVDIYDDIVASPTCAMPNYYIDTYHGIMKPCISADGAATGVPSNAAVAQEQAHGGGGVGDDALAKGLTGIS